MSVERGGPTVRKCPVDIYREEPGNEVSRGGKINISPAVRLVAKTFHWKLFIRSALFGQARPDEGRSDGQRKGQNPIISKV